MNNTLAPISLWQLSFAFIPVIAVLLIFFKWNLPKKRSLVALTRMLVQLLLVGYFLSYIFSSDSAWLVLVLLVVMVLFSSHIAINNINAPKLSLFKKGLVAIMLSGSFTLFVITQGVLELQPWYKAQTIIPLAGMIFANCMNSVSLCGERFYAEIKTASENLPKQSEKALSNENTVQQLIDSDYIKARNTAFHVSMIPNINALLAVGIVSLPGMMTGQILSGISPFIAARYQIMVMCMIFASAGLASALFLILNKPPKAIK